MTIKSIVGAVALALAATAAHADHILLAALASVDGKILVNQGHGFEAAKPGMALGDGDRVIALDGSRAAVVYSDGCVTQLKENSLLAMDKAVGCKKEVVGTGGAPEQPIRVAQAIGGPLPSAGPRRQVVGGGGPGVGLGAGLGINTPSRRRARLSAACRFLDTTIRNGVHPSRRR